MGASDSARAAELVERTLPAKPLGEDWSGVADKPFKDIALGDGMRLNLGGDARWKAEMLDAPRLGASGEKRDSWMVQRLLAHADLHVTEQARVFVQLGAHDAIGREIRSANDDNRFDLNQAFVDYVGKVGDAAVTFRAGRQEIFLGNPRAFTLRDNNNLRQRHDALRLSVRAPAWGFDLFGGRPTFDRPGVFDDEADPAQEFFGVRVERRMGSLLAEAQLFDLTRDDFHIAGLVADDRRRTWSVRLSGKKGNLDLDAEADWQSGTFGNEEVAAFGGALELGRTFPDVVYAPRAALRLTYGGGDSDPADRKQQTYAPPFPRSQWFGQTGLASFSNTFEAATTLTLNPAPNVRIDSKVSGLWRADTGDFAYSGNANALANTRGGDAYIGTAPSVSLQWRVSPHLLMSTYLGAIWVSQQMQAFAGNDASYANVTALFTF